MTMEPKQPDSQVSVGTVATYIFDGEQKFVDKRYSNLKSDVVEITHDKLENLLLKFYQKHLLRTIWFNPLSLLVGVALTLTTAEFKASALGIEGATWKAIFMIALTASLIWFAVSLIRLAANWKETSLDYLIGKIKNARDEA
jgi:hypothetical protein